MKTIMNLERKLSSIPQFKWRKTLQMNMIGYLKDLPSFPRRITRRILLFSLTRKSWLVWCFWCPVFIIKDGRNGIVLQSGLFWSWKTQRIEKFEVMYETVWFEMRRTQPRVLVRFPVDATNFLYPYLTVFFIRGKLEKAQRLHLFAIVVAVESSAVYHGWLRAKNWKSSRRKIDAEQTKPRDGTCDVMVPLCIQ